MKVDARVTALMVTCLKKSTSYSLTVSLLMFFCRLLERSYEETLHFLLLDTTE